MQTKWLILMAALLMFPACGDESADKGAEEEELTDGKSDSFFRPTEHGPMRWDSRNPGTIEADARFHAWTFTLSGPAKVDLKTEISKNLDTVMYLYRRDVGTDSWGRYIKKNDDFEGNIWSGIVRELDEGEYRVIVKPFKKAMSGGFSLVGTCDGAGCEEPAAGQCRKDEFESLPAQTPYTKSCATRILTVLNSEVEFTSGGEIEVPMHCDLKGIELRGVDYYHEWWDDIAGFDDMFKFDPDEEVVLNFETRAHDQGTVISVDAGGDEDGMTLIFDHDDNLLAIYQHNQSPTLDFFCGGANEAPTVGPDEDCFSDVMWALPHGDEVGEDSGTTSVADAAGLHGAVGSAVAAFAAANGLQAADEIDFVLHEWNSLDAEDAAEVALTDASGTVTYYLSKDFRNNWNIRMRSDADGDAFVCD